MHYIAVIAACGGLLFSPSRSEPGATRPVKAIYFERCIFLPMQIDGGEALLFLLDTGANVSAIDIKVAQRLHLLVEGTSKVEGTAGVITVKKARLKRLSVAGAQVENLTVTAQDLAASMAPKGRRLDGILGYDFLHHFRIHIDFSSSTLTFSDHSQEPLESARQTVALPLTISDGIPRLKAMLNGSVEVDLRLDTGASLFATEDVYINATEATWKKLVALDASLKPVRYFRGQGAGGEVKLPVARIASLSAGGLTAFKPYVIVQPKAGYFARPDAVGFLSNNFLEKYSPATVDYLKMKLLLTLPERQ
jgi:hypothetical protein